MEPKVNVNDDGSVFVEYGDSMGSETFHCLKDARRVLFPWMEKQYDGMGKRMDSLRRMRNALRAAQQEKGLRR